MMPGFSTPQKIVVGRIAVSAVGRPTHGPFDEMQTVQNPSEIMELFDWLATSTIQFVGVGTCQLTLEWGAHSQHSLSPYNKAIFREIPAFSDNAQLTRNVCRFQG